MATKIESVEIWWRDAVAQAGWQRAEEISEPKVVCTIGWLVNETEAAYMVASSWALEEGQDAPEFNATITIPKGMVEKINKGILT